MAKLTADPYVAYYTAEAQNISSQYLIPTAIKACDAELQLNRTCHLDLGDWTQFAGIPAFLDAFRGNITRVDPQGKLCFQNLNVVENIPGVGKAELFINGIDVVPLASGCSHEDALAFLAWEGNAAHTAQAGVFSLDYSFETASCYMM